MSRFSKIRNFSQGLRDRIGQSISAWTPKKNLKVEEYKRTQEVDEKEEAMHKARLSANMKRRVRAVGVWFPSDGTP